MKRAAWAVAMLLMTAGLSLALYRSAPPPPTLLIAGGIAGLAVLALAIAKLEAAVALGFVLLGVVKVEPAPPDLVFACVIAVSIVTGRFDLSRVQPVVLAIVGAFLAVNVLSMVQVVDPVRATAFVTITLYLAVFSLWLASYLDSVRKARAIVVAYLAIALFSVIVGLLALFGPLPLGDLVLFHGDRVQALFKDANVFGPFLVPITLILLEETLTPRLLSVRTSGKAVMLAILVLGVVFAFSRAGWLNLGVGTAFVLMITLMRRGGSRRALALVATLLVGGLLALGAIAATGSEAFLEERATFQSYDIDRFGAQEEGFAFALQHPLGIGPGQFEQVAPISAHSTYIRVLTEAGFLGFAILIALALATLILGLRNAALGRSTYGIGSAALVGAWAGLLANGVFIDTLHWRHLWVVAALIWVGAMRPQPELGQIGSLERRGAGSLSSTSGGRSVR